MKENTSARRLHGEPSAPYTVQLKRVRDPRGFGLLLYVYGLMAIVYVLVRTSLVNWHVWYGPLLYFAELYGLMTTAMFLFIAQRMYHPVHRATKLQKTVDVFVPTYSESLAILEPVVLGAQKIRGVRHVLVLDDGNRLEVRAMARRLGVTYHPRTTNLHAKAGNLNNGLRFSDAEFLLMLDADHIPSPAFLERTLGYLDDPALAFVQTPQTFYNTTSFLFRRWRGQRSGWSEQMMFYDCIQPAKNRWNAAFFVGTSALIRRAALDSVGGFATGTATEDIHTSLRLHAQGWKSLFLPEALAYGLEAESIKEFYKQRQRWAAGSLGLLFRSPDSPLRARGLSFTQRLNYLAATLAHLQGIQKVCFFIVPIATLFTGVSPLHGSLATYIVIFSSYLAISLGSNWAYSRGTYHMLYNEAYSLANMMAHFGGIKGVIKIQKKFAVSQKTAQRKERTRLTTLLWSLAGIGALADLRDSWLYFIDHKHLAIMAYSLIFITLNLGILLSFLLHLRTYENRGTNIVVYNGLSSLDMYRHITGTFKKLVANESQQR